MPGVSGKINARSARQVVSDTENRAWMVLDEFDIHPEKESERGMLDWDRTHFLTKCYRI